MSGPPLGCAAANLSPVNAAARHTVTDVLDALNRHEVRATYGAVAEVVLGDRRKARSLSGLLGQRGPRASWVVNARTKEPTDYLDDLKHPNLYRRSRVITTGDELRRLL